MISLRSWYRKSATVTILVTALAVVVCCSFCPHPSSAFMVTPLNSHECGGTWRDFSLKKPMVRLVPGKPRKIRQCTTWSTSSSIKAVPTEEDQKQDVELSSEDRLVVDFVTELSSSSLPYRIIVVGKDGSAILESTQILGPNLTVSPSPKNPNEKLMTVSSTDKSFEYHLKISQVASISIIEKDRPGLAGSSNKNSENTMRLIRFLNADGESITSMIVGSVADDDDRPQQLFAELFAKYGTVVEVRK